jgi:phosphatidylglycerophosphate synthase
VIHAALLPLQRQVLHPPARRLVALALGLIALNRIMDGLYGAVARLTGPTDREAFLDIALDFVFYALVPLGLPAPHETKKP